MTASHRFLSFVLAFTCLATVHGVGGGSPSSAGGVGAHQARAGLGGAPVSRPGIPSTYGLVCAQEPVNHYLPKRSGCVTAYRAAVGSNKRDGWVVLYANLSHHSVLLRGRVYYVPASWQLEMATPHTVARIRIEKGALDPFILRIGNLNGVAGDEVIVQPYDVSSGDPETIYTLSSGTIHTAGTFTAGGDSLNQQRFSCRMKPTPEVVSDIGIATADGASIFKATWKWTSVTYVWRGLTLIRASSHVFYRKGIRSIAPPTGAWGAHCGTLVGKASDE